LVASSKVKRLFYRCIKRGTKENELLFRAFAERYLDQLSLSDLDDLDVLLNCLDADLTHWLFHPETLPLDYDTAVFRLLKTLKEKGLG